jgi:hypothetical protein
MLSEKLSLELYETYMGWLRINELSHKERETEYSMMEIGHMKNYGRNATMEVPYVKERMMRCICY